MISRNQSQTQASGCIYIPFQNKLMCIYSAYEKNIDSELTDKVKKENETKELVLAAAIIGDDGKIISRKKMAENTGGKNYFFISKASFNSDNHILIPIGRNKISMVKYYTELVQMASLEIK